ncbi:MAG TPA: DUF1592 domain-containing protein [Gammaproteobacteria bacterium]
MRQRPTIPGLALIACAVALVAGCGRDSALEHAGTVSANCMDCHNSIDMTAGLSLEGLDFDAIPADAEIWEKVIRKLRAGMMPPSDGPTLARETRSQLVAWLETELDAAAERAPDPGRKVAFHRLNRAEFRNAVRDLLDVDIDVDELLPGDDVSFGFDNIAGVSKVSPTLLERYLGAADVISRLAVGRPAPFENIDYFRVPDDLSQERRLPGMPYGTRGGTRISYTFPVDAEYVIAPRLQRDLNESMPAYAEDQQLEVSIDGERVAMFTLPGAGPRTPPPPPPAADAAGDGNNGGMPPISQIERRVNLSRAERAARNRADEGWEARVPVSAGRRDVVVTFIGRTAALDETARLPFLRPYPSGVNIPETRTGSYLLSVEISGPYDAGGTGESLASREKIFVCEPAADLDLECAESILAALARRAYRRPVEAADVEPLLAFFEEGAADAGFDAGIQVAIKRLLVAPEFLFRIEQDPEELPAGTPYELDALALASRLSFFLWSSIPDERLLGLAESGELEDEAVLEAEVRRMIADPKADAFVENFAGQWLYLRNLDAIVPVQSNFPDFDDTLRQGLRRETELFFTAIVREDRSAFELLDADFTYLNERVAKHYGIPGIKGSHFRRVELGPDDPRRGLLGHGSILAVTSYPDRTSPVIRGKWILENLLGAPPPNPPPDVPGLVATDGAGTVISMRERFAVHRENPSCASCHALMDPLGFALENFNAIGQWRTLGDAGEAIDASGAMPDGTSFDGISGLKVALGSSDQFLTTFTEKLLTYAVGRGMEHHDMPAVRHIVRDAAADDYRMTSFIMGVVKSAPFRMRSTGA